MITLLRANRDLRWLFIAQVISFMGDWFSFVAVTGIVKDATGSEFLVSLAYVSFSLNKFERSDWWVVVGRSDGQEFQRGSVMVIARGFLQFFQRLLDADGRYYFDEPDFQPDVVL